MEGTPVNTKEAEHYCIFAEMSAYTMKKCTHPYRRGRNRQPSPVGISRPACGRRAIARHCSRACAASVAVVAGAFKYDDGKLRKPGKTKTRPFKL